jgi:preprotein translocase subunit SecF
MGFMKKMGGGMARMPVVPLVVLMVVTIASLGIIATNPPSFDMDQGSFQPDNEITRAYGVINDTFTSMVPVVSLVDAGDGNIFDKDSFIAILKYEQALAEMKYTDRTDVEKSFAALPMFRVFSPISAIAAEIVADEAVPWPGDLNPLVLADQYEYMIRVVSGVSDETIKEAAYDTLTDGFAGMRLTSLLSTVHSIESADEIYAKGCMVSTMIAATDLADIQRGMLGFEQYVIHEAKEFTSTNDADLTVRAAGLATIMSDIGTLAQRDIAMLLPIALAVIIILLLLIYRDLADTLIGLLGLVIAIIWTFAVSTVAGIQITTIAIAVPILILALGIDYSLHLVFRYREERKNGADLKEAIGKTMGSVGEALTLATVTTAIAFLSYQTSAMSALADFGMMCAIGIVCAFGAMLLLVPPMQAIRGRRAEKKGKESKHYVKAENGKDTLGKIAGIGGKMAAKRPAAVLGVVALVIVLFGYSATNLSYSFNMYDFIPEGTEASDTLRYLDDNFSATTDTTDVLIYGDVWDLDTLRAIELSLRNMENSEIPGLTYFESKIYAEHLGTALRDLRGSVPPPDDIDYDLAFTTLFKDDGRLQDWVVLGINDTAAQGVLDGFKAFSLNPLFKLALASVVGETPDGPVTRIILHMDDVHRRRLHPSVGHRRRIHNDGTIHHNSLIHERDEQQPDDRPVRDDSVRSADTYDIHVLHRQKPSARYDGDHPHPDIGGDGLGYDGAAGHTAERHDAYDSIPGRGNGRYVRHTHFTPLRH